jgi:hypothetical protein
MTFPAGCVLPPRSFLRHASKWPHRRRPPRTDRRISRGGRSQRPRCSVTAVPEAVGLVADFAGVTDGSVRKSAPTWLRSHAQTSLRGRPASAGNEVCQAWRYVPGTGRALVAGSSEMGAAGVTGAEPEALEGAGWEFLVGHAPGTTGMTGLREPDDQDMRTGRPISESDGPYRGGSQVT